MVESVLVFNSSFQGGLPYIVGALRSCINFDGLMPFWPPAFVY